MKTIASFEVDHTKLNPGMYISRVDKDVITYDLRFIHPNTPPFLENGAIHTLEHLFATFIRNSDFSDSVVYFGPMGCRTGFYLLLRDDVSKQDAIKLTQNALKYIGKYENEIPGTKPKECGNYKEHNLQGAKKLAVDYLEVIIQWNNEMLNYSSNV